jgi:hypothetical protein
MPTRSRILDRSPLAALCVASSLLLLSGCQTTAEVRDGAPLLFDDFSYASFDAFNANGWKVRTAAGWPGIEGASWSDGVSLIQDPDHSGNRLVRMTARTDGVSTHQAQFCHERKYYEGTYAARVRFTDRPISGPDGDQVVQTFYTIAPLRAPLDPDYSEQDFEYLPNGGWGGGELALHTTTWETFRLEPWLPVNANRVRNGSLEGWRTLLLQIANQEVRYFLDGEPLATHGEPYYPEDRMSINFNLWFIRDGLISSREPRIYQQDIDWVLHVKGAVLTPAEVERKVTELRASDVSFRDSIEEMTPSLLSPCDF